MFSMWRGKIAIESWNEWGENANEVDCIKTDCLYHGHSYSVYLIQ